MKKYKYFRYDEELHFTICKEMKGYVASLNSNGFIDIEKDIWSFPKESLLERTIDPNNADFFFFPYDIGWMTDTQDSATVAKYLADLPYYKGNEKRHVFFDHGDKQSLIDIPSIFFKVSVPCKTRNKSIHQIWYDIPDHVKNDKYTFNMNNMKYQTSFIGSINNDIRKYITRAISIDKRIKSCVDTVEGKVKNGFYTKPMISREEKRIRSLLFRETTKKSYTVLCLPGIGPLSVRLFETMYYGRIPILIKDISSLPRNDIVNYSEFCIFFEINEISRIGEIISHRISSMQSDQIAAMCKKACKTWHTVFSKKNLNLYIVRSIQKHLDQEPDNAASRSSSVGWE